MTAAEDLKGQRVALTDDGSGGEQECETPEKLLGKAADKPLRDSALPCFLIAALLAAFGVVACVTGGILMAAFGNRAPSSDARLAIKNQTTLVEGNKRALLPGSSAWLWKASTEANGAYRVRCYNASNGGALSWAEAINGLAIGRLGPVLSKQLLLSPHADAAFFFELPPLTLALAARIPFEFVTIAAPALASASVDPQPFAHHLASCAGSLSAKAFSNLGGDAMLVAPCNAAPRVDERSYATLAQFLHGAPAEQIEKLWTRVGSTLRATLRERGAQPTWVSTEGSGVSWLHGPYTRSPTSGQLCSLKTPDASECR
uniref:Uncharacterized protein n=1 Tax=Haptolina brevifila TaxID=156173 RepID=A0A7S2GUU9_9EUKA|mmetsp:Transcript_47473/g.94796  ORF Transcript_47473/g.94796 Transcript_47473/m.94796 type:complete len:316 (+) Transcript_47473:140-1087(+)